MIATKVVAFVVLAYLGVAAAQVAYSGPCPCGVNVIPKFDVGSYLGTWYEYAKYPTAFEAGGICETAEYSLLPDGNVGVRNTMVIDNNGTLSIDDIVGVATPVENAKLLVTFPISPSFNVSSNYWVLDTDYVQYAVVYSCNAINSTQHTVTSWILTREQLPRADAIDRAVTVLLRNGVSLSEFQVTKQFGCN